ncbi:MAG TPA: hypothetical protein VK586_07965 [Streptosporangiaceae bacterium]|nr:hypothetical protein [Streptosporangiaceae bacterium]
MSPGHWIRFLSGPDIDGLNLTSAEIVAAAQGAVLAHGRGRALVEPRVYLTPDNDGASRSSATSSRTTPAACPASSGC